MFLKKLKVGQSERLDGPRAHLKKQGTPTMGGIMMIISIILFVLSLVLYIVITAKSEEIHDDSTKEEKNTKAKGVKKIKSKNKKIKNKF